MQDRRNDHRVVGRELDLFDTTPAVGAGLPLWLPAGAVIRGELERLALEEALASGCRRVYTPVLAKRELFERSGHWAKFSAEMFPEMLVGGERFVLRPANCPHHAQVFAARAHSYRDLPVRYAELGSMFRSELSGVLGGLSRVRQISLDDAHVFAREDQVVDEVRTGLRAILRCYDVLGIEVDHLRLSVRGPRGDYLGDDAQWELAEEQLRAALDAEGLPHRRGEGEAAFYGPKVDVQVRDAAGREESLSTVQVDHNLPERFDLGYIGPDGARHRPVMVHRGLLSSMERMTALLLEQHGGRLPTWLAPVQVRVLPVDERDHGRAAAAVAVELRAAGIRAELSSSGTLGARIRQSRQQRDAYLAVIGDAEVSDGTLALTSGASGARLTLPRTEAIAAIGGEIRRRELRAGVTGS